MATLVYSLLVIGIMQFMGASPNHSGTTLTQWSEVHSAAMLAMVIPVMLHAPVATVSLVAAISFAGLIIRNRSRWTPNGRFGAANIATSIRLLLILLIPFLPAYRPLPRILCAFTALLLDGLDGWLARRFQFCSAFGELFDLEADAVFILLLGMILYDERILRGWVLIPGCLRYGFVLFVKFAQPPSPRETGTFLGKAICIATLVAMLLCLLPIPAFHTPLALTANFLLAGSFATSVRKSYRVQSSS